MDSLSEYAHDEQPGYSSSYLLPPVLRLAGSPCRVFEVGCGNGTTAHALASRGFDVTGVDTSEAGVRIARKGPGRFSVASVYDDLAGTYGQFPLVISLEVIEHCFWAHKYARAVFDLVQPGGTAIISTPYHGYLKNLVLAATGKMDAHFNALRDGGHIKFFSEETLGTLLRQAGFSSVEFHRAGRIPALAKSMIAVTRRT